jgi:hypothetical protein
MNVHILGERRRTVALASLFTLALYLVAAAIPRLAPASDIGKGVGRFFALPALVQGGIVALIWLGWWIVWMAQRELVAHGEGIYAVPLAISQVRGMRGAGLFFGLLVAAILAVTAIFGTLTLHLAVAGVLVALALIALGLPASSSSIYQVPPSDTALVPVPNTPPSRRVVDAV